MEYDKMFVSSGWMVYL